MEEKISEEGTEDAEFAEKGVESSKLKEKRDSWLRPQERLK